MPGGEGGSEGDGGDEGGGGSEGGAGGESGGGAAHEPQLPRSTSGRGLWSLLRVPLRMSGAVLAHRSP